VYFTGPGQARRGGAVGPSKQSAQWACVYKRRRWTYSLSGVFFSCADQPLTRCFFHGVASHGGATRLSRVCRRRGGPASTIGACGHTVCFPFFIFILVFVLMSRLLGVSFRALPVTAGRRGWPASTSGACGHMVCFLCNFFLFILVFVLISR
jgi:hypothetical protein